MGRFRADHRSWRCLPIEAEVGDSESQQRTGGANAAHDESTLLQPQSGGIQDLWSHGTPHW